MSKSINEAEELISALGGDVQAAEFWEVTRQAVAKFRKQGRIPNARMLHLKAARPDLFAGQHSASREQAA